MADLSATAALPLENFSQSFASSMYFFRDSLSGVGYRRGATALANGLGTIYDIATITGQAASWVNAYSRGSLIYDGNDPDTGVSRGKPRRGYRGRPR